MNERRAGTYCSAVERCHVRSLLCAMLIAAVAVSVGAEFPFIALANSMLQGVEVGPAEFTHPPRMSANVSIVACGTTPLPLGVVANDTPLPRDSRFVTVANALGTSVEVASVLLLNSTRASSRWQNPRWHRPRRSSKFHP